MRTDKCVELYGGVGTIGLHLLDIFGTLVCSDENPHNLACFDKAVASLPKAYRKRATYCQKSAEGMVAAGHISPDVDVVIVDPPRKGLDDVTLDKLCERQTGNRLKLLVYVSCGFDAFKRNAEALVKNGGWSVTQAEGYVLFPGADHIETLAVFERR